MTRERAASTGRNIIRWLAPLVAILAGAGLALGLIARSERDGMQKTRLAAVDAQLANVAARAEAASVMRNAARGPNPDTPPPRFKLHCPEPWQELGAIGQGLWGCRTLESVAGGFYPNCNLTTSQGTPGGRPQQYYETARQRSAQLSAASRLPERSLVVHGRPAYEATFEHSSTGRPLRVLATMLVDGEHVYAITCSSPPESFEGLAPRFRDIAGSFELQSGG